MDERLQEIVKFKKARVRWTTASFLAGAFFTFCHLFIEPAGLYYLKWIAIFLFGLGWLSLLAYSLIIWGLSRKEIE